MPGDNIIAFSGPKREFVKVAPLQSKPSQELPKVASVIPKNFSSYQSQINHVLKSLNHYLCDLELHLDK